MNNILIANLPSFGLNAIDYVDLIKWENVAEPPLSERLNYYMISEALVNPLGK